MILLVMGVSGSGKTTVGTLLAQELGWEFLDADDCHPPDNVDKLEYGMPLTDQDRYAWLQAVAWALDEHHDAGRNVVVACSALKQEYQDYFTGRFDPIEVVYLHGSEELLRKRLEQREGHFMNPNLIHSQIETLEPPENALTVSIDQPPDAITAEIRNRLGLDDRPGNP